jgi:hypothetical protein
MGAVRRFWTLGKFAVFQLSNPATLKCQVNETPCRGIRHLGLCLALGCLTAAGSGGCCRGTG